MWNKFDSNTMNCWDETTLKRSIRRSPAVAIRALMLVYSYQLEIEKASGDSIERNNVGFGLYDVEELTALAKQKIGGRKLLPHQVDKLRRVMPKYWRQVLNEVIRRNPERILRKTKSYVILQKHHWQILPHSEEKILC